MKKTILSIFAFTLISLTSCSSDDSATTDPGTATDVLVKRIIRSQEDTEGFNDIITYTYDGNKLLEANYLDGTKEKYYYTGDLITKVEYLFEGQIEAQDLFVYDAAGKLIESKLQDFDDDSEEKELFVYNNDNTITKTYITGRLNNPSTTGQVSTLTLDNDEIVKIVNNGVGGKTYKYSYDTKNSPFKNVTGYAKIAYAFHGDFELEGKKHNIASIKNETDNQNYTVNTMQYNSDDYPTRVVSDAIFFSGNPTNVETLTVQYFYE